MAKKAYILISLSAAILIVSFIGGFAYLKVAGTPKPTLHIRTDETIQAMLTIRQKFLNETVILYQSDPIGDTHQEIEVPSKTGESSIVLIIEGTEETILGYLDIRQSLSYIDLRIEHTEHGAEVRYTVGSSSGKIAGDRLFPLG